MRVVVDTNVFISAALKDRSTPAFAVRLIERLHTLLKSIATEQQLIEVMARPYLSALIAPSTREWLMRLIASAESVLISTDVTTCRDSTDDKFLELAADGRADLILSGDADLLVLHPFRGIPILSPAAFTHGPAA